MSQPSFFIEDNSHHTGPALISFFKKNIYAVAVFLFVTGILCRNKTCITGLLNFIFQLTGKVINPEFRLIGFHMMGSCLLLFGFLLLLFKLAGAENTIFSKKQFLFTAPLLIVLFYWNTVTKNMVNIPITDDYFTVLNFLNAYIPLQDPAEKWNRIIAPYVETRNVFTKLIVIGTWKLTGQINFTWFIILINIGLSGIGYFIYKASAAVKQSHYLIIPLFLFLFQFSFYDAQIWTTSGIHTLCTMCFACSAFFFLHKNTMFTFIAALVMAILASLTYGNGLLVFPVGLIILLKGARKMQIGIWTCTCILLVIGYFNNYTPVRTVSEVFSFNPLLLLIYCMTFLGSAFQFMYRPELPMLAGGAFLLLAGWLTRKKYYTLNMFNYCLMVYIILSALLASAFRFENQQHIQQALANRYVIYSCLAVCCSMIALSEIKIFNLEKQIKLWILIVAAVYYLMSAFFFYPEVVIRKNKLTMFSKQLKNNLSVTYYPPVIPEGADTIIQTAIRNGFYNPAE